MPDPVRPALGEEDYRQLTGMLLSEDAGQRSRAAALAQKMTPVEQQQFFDVQQKMHAGSDLQVGRPDASLLGMPPELVALGGLGVMRGVAGATGLTGKAVSAAKSAATSLGPIAKYEVVKSALKHIGLSDSAATAIATGIVATTGGGGGKTAAPATVAQTAEAAAVPAAEAAAVEAPVVAARAAPPPVGVTPTPSPIAAPRVPPVGPVAPPVAPVTAPVLPQNPLSPVTPPVAAGPRIVMSPQRIQNELGLAAIRANLKLTEPQFAAAETLVRAGKTPVEAVTTVASGPAAAAVEAPTVVTAAGESAGKLKLNRDELNEYVRMTKSGISPADAVMAIAKQRQLQQALGTPTTSDVVRRVVERNVTGRWKP
jgi:hypothetical protein